MKLLLTSAGITNPSLREALVDLLGKPIEESSALLIPTAIWAKSMAGAERTWVFITGNEPRTPMAELGWKSLGVLELTALPSIGDERWVKWVREADALLVNGGDALYLAHWMRQCGLDSLLPSLDSVYVGLSAGSMAMTPRIGQDFVDWKAPDGSDEALAFVDFSIFPHLDHPALPENTMTDAERWAAGMTVPCYAIDDATGIRVVDGAVDVISEGHWRFFDAAARDTLDR
jgi:dipeptidase E